MVYNRVHSGITGYITTYNRVSRATHPPDGIDNGATLTVKELLEKIKGILILCFIYGTEVAMRFCIVKSYDVQNRIGEDRMGITGCNLILWFLK